MDVFISWSGEKSKIIAESLYWFLPRAINTITPWISTNEIYSGSRWGKDLSENLNKINAGILCLTKENLSVPWILFEAGALSKSIELGIVIPYLFGFKKSDIEYPLAQFQSELCNRDGTKKLITSLYQLSLKAGELSVPAEAIYETFDKYWNDFEKRIQKIPIKKEARAPRPERDILEEILSLVRESKYKTKVINQSYGTKLRKPMRSMATLINNLQEIYNILNDNVKLIVLQPKEFLSKQGIDTNQTTIDIFSANNLENEYQYHIYWCVKFEK